VLSGPVDVQGDPKSDLNGETVRDVKKVQLILPATSRCLIGKDVVAKGALFHAFTGHHYTDVVMNVVSLAESPRAKTK
jgi:hypothetical protein